VELTPERIALALMAYVVLLFSLSVHESAHGWMALRMGDDTAARQGRITLNPLSHIELFGTVLIPLLQFLYSGIPLLGWAKPTPVGAHNFRRLARGHVLVALAGPVSNLLLAILFTGGLFLGLRLLGFPSDPRDPHLVVTLLTIGIQMNVVLALFNLVPLPPLDGSWIVSWGLPRSISAPYDRIMEPYGQWILLILFATSVLGRVLSPFTSALARFLLALAR
jgi:Zn-dependent protease